MITFMIPYPPKFTHEYGLNPYYSGLHWSIRKRRADAWHWTVRAALQEHGIRPKIFKKPVKITFYWDDRLDIDNHAIAGKMTVDALKGYLLEDDSKKHLRAVEHQFWNGGYIKVEIEEVVAHDEPSSIGKPGNPLQSAGR